MESTLPTVHTDTPMKGMLIRHSLAENMMLFEASLSTNIQIKKNPVKMILETQIELVGAKGYLPLIRFHCSSRGCHVLVRKNDTHTKGITHLKF
mmetsp:Transcript_296/g.414  ORF Transcript_296/g.414 Transcript_296/m.414 type:complete len:94 (+) Transcript_296:1425-1706(+)